MLLFGPYLIKGCRINVGRCRLVRVDSYSQRLHVYGEVPEIGIGLFVHEIQTRKQK